MSVHGSSPPADPSPSFPPGTRLGEYVVVRQIGAGGMAGVWLARHLPLDRPVALKILRPEFAADPRALPLAVAAAQACEMVGLPECQLNLAQAVVYLAVAPKSNSATVAIETARGDIKDGRVVPVPRFLRDAHYRGSQELGHVGYQYAHDCEGAVAPADYLGVDRTYYTPTDRGFERKMSARLEKIKAILHGGNNAENTENAENAPEPEVQPDE